MYRWCRRKKGDIAVIAALVTIFIIGVSQTEDFDSHETIERDIRARNIGRKQLQADIEYFSNQAPDHRRESMDNLKPVAIESEHLGTSKVIPDERPSLLVYIYDLPSMFNTDLLHCATNDTDDVHGRSEARLRPNVDGLDSHNTVNVEDYLEVRFHRTLLNSNYVTTDASVADVLYIPFYSTLACDCGNRIDITELHSQLWKFLDDALPYFRNGKPSRPHFMTMSTHERHHWTKKCPLLRDKNHTRGIIFIGPEKESNVELRKYAGRDSSQMIVAPYPSRHEPTVEDVEQRRNILTFFPDSTRSLGRGIRTFLREEITRIHTPSMSEDPPDTDTFAVRFMDSLEDRNSRSQPYSQTAYKWMRRSIFCLQAPSDTEISISLYDAISAGCIPVTFLPWKKRRKVELPFEDRLDYTMFTINIPPDRVLSGEQNTTWYLSTVPKLRITILQRRLREHSKQLLYSDNHKTKNAFDMIIGGMVSLSS